MKPDFQKIQIHPKDHYKTIFIVLLGQYEWYMMPFGLKNTPHNFKES